MQFIVKFFPEITIKSRPVRTQFSQKLRDNLKTLLKPIDADIVIEREWDRLIIRSALNDSSSVEQVVTVLRNTPGIANFLEVVSFDFVDLHQAYLDTQSLWGDRLQNKSFVVRVKREGKHPFNSIEAERYIGGGLNQHNATGGVNLHTPDITIRVEIRHDKVFVVNRRFEGLGGFPLGSLDSVVSLISGGFDSTVATYLMMRRGMRCHFVFFNLGGRDHEIGVKEVAFYLWNKFGASSRVRFITVPFEGVVAELLKNVNDSYMGVILKRMMLRAATRIAEQLEIKALVTGEAVAQVSSQTLANLAVIDRATDLLVMRPLIASDKVDIIHTAERIGTAAFAAHMPEYCGVISVKPTTRAKPEKVEHEETRFDMQILEDAIAAARHTNIDEVMNDLPTAAEVEVFSIPVGESIIIDVRHPGEEELKPLQLDNNKILKIPFYELHKKFAELDKQQTYLLYCDKGVMSRLHASHLVADGHKNVKVYRPT